MRTKSTLESADMRAMLDAALDAAAQAGLSVSVAVVDDGGYLLGAQRDDGAGMLTADVAIRKARTAALLRAPSSRLADRVVSDPALLRLTEYLPMAGGVPVIVDGQCVGAVGVSGAAADQDHAIAEAGAQALPASA